MTKSINGANRTFTATGAGGNFKSADPDGSAATVSAAISGTIMDADEADIVAGGETLIITITDDDWLAAGSSFNAQRQAIIDGVVSAQSEANGFNAERSNLPVTDCVRTSDKVVTITLSALASYSVTASETLTITVPASSLVISVAAVVGSPTVSITESGIEILPTDWPSWHNIGSVNGGTVSTPEANRVVGNYPIPTGGDYVFAIYRFDEDYEEIFIEFDAKMPNVKHGLKFMKVFGQDDAGKANCTFGLNYTGIDNGSFDSIAFGDGTSVNNDTQSIIKLDGTSNAAQLGRNFGAATILTPQSAPFPSSAWGTDWHSFKMSVKFNSGTTSGNETNDGKFYLEIDGDIYVNATDIWNRHYTNPPILQLGLFGWSQSGLSAFDVEYRDVVISTGGFG